MSLIEKKLKKLQPGTRVKLTMKDENKSQFLGLVSDNDFEESLEITGDFGELIVMYAEISSFLVVTGDEDVSVKKPEKKDDVQPVKHDSVTQVPKKIEDLSFYSEIDYPKMSDTDLDAYLKNELYGREKGIANRHYQSFKSKLKNKNYSECKDAIIRMLNDFDNYSDEISNNAYRFALSLQVRVGSELDEETLLYTESYDYMAVNYYKKGDHFRAAVCSCLAVISGYEDRFHHVLYTILAATSIELTDFSGLSYILLNMPMAENQPEIYELLSFIYEQNQRRYSSSLNVNTIISELDELCISRRIEPAVRKQLESVNKENFKQLTELPSTNGVPPKEQTVSVENAPVPEKPSPEQKKGEVFQISWSSDKGKILSDDKEYDFTYSDIADKKLLSKLQKLTTRDLRAINSVFQVEFMLLNGKVSNIKEIHVAVKQAKPVEKKKIYHYTPDECRLNDNTPNESSLRKARKILADSNNPNRFEESLAWLEKAFSEENDPLVPMSQYITCCVTITNQTGDETYTQRAYEAYLRFRDLVLATTGIAGNVAVMDLFVKMKKTDEAIAAAGRILADPKLAVEIRLHYIHARARLYMEKAAALENIENASQEEIKETYEHAIAAFMDWEQRFSDTPSFRKDINKKKMYYNTVLYNIAKCQIKLDNPERAEDILKKIIAFDPSNDNAKSMLKSLLADSETLGKDESGNGEEGAVLPGFWDDDFYYDEETAEDQIQFEEYKDVSGWKALGISKQEVIDYAIGCVADGKTYAAVAYLKAASNLDEKITPTYTMISLAVNHPLESFDYRLENVILQYSRDNSDRASWESYAQAAAIIRGSFYHSAENDYFAASAYLSRSVMDSVPSLGKVMEYIDAFRSSTGKGMDLYADYRYHSDDSQNFALVKTAKEAKELHERYYGRLFHETASQKRFKLTKAIVFEKTGFIEQILLCVIENNTEKFRELQQDFSDKFIRDGFTASSDNIDNNKIEAFIDEAWNKAGKDKSIHERVSSTLMGSLRNNIRIPIARIVELVCSWLTLNANLNSEYTETDLALYRSNRASLLDALSQTKDELEKTQPSDDASQKAGLNLLRDTVAELIKRINGTWSEEQRRYYFAAFLRTDNILLNDDFLPDLTFTFCDMPTFNVLSRIRAHVEDTDADMVEYAKTIYTRAEEKHDFGTAEKIAVYLKYLGRESEWAMPENTDVFDEQARKQLRERYDRFTDDIASARSRGQINVSDDFLLSIDITAQSLYQYCLETKNYGFFFRFISLCLESIHEKALEYGFVLNKQLERLSNEFEMDESIYNKISAHIETQQFTVAEEMMYRFEKGDIVDDSDIPQETNEYLTQFWEEFDSNYSTIARDRGTTLAKIISTHGAMKDRRGGEALVNNWPRGDRCSVEQIETLLKLLGWSGIEVKKSTTRGNLLSFAVKPDIKVFSQREYAHPISAFGTQAYNDGFYVVCLFGTTDSVRLIDICKRLDSITGNKLILVDFALSSGERRKLARLMKQVSFANTYMFVDRVSLLYLANHYVGGVANANNRALFAVSMPFTYFQPYVIGSSSRTDPELFSGRKEELLSVERPDGANLIYGGRQLGKTAILKKAVNETHDPEKGRYAFAIDIKDKNCKDSAIKISRWLSTEGIFTENQITDDWEMIASYIHKSINDKSVSYLLLMLDEADAFIDDCRNVDFAPFVALKDIQQSTNGKFKFVLAGLHNIVRFKREIALGKNSVIAHLSSINVKPFDYETAKTLLREPLSYLGFDFDDDNNSFMQICSATNYYPGLLQMFCHKLIDSLKTNYGGYSESDTPGYKVTSRHISKVLADREFMAAIKEKFEITIRLGEGHYYILALLLAMLYEENEKAEGYGLDEILRLADSWGINSFEKLGEEHIKALLDELCDLNILKTIDSCYAFRTRSFRDLLGSKSELEEQLISMI